MWQDTVGFTAIEIIRRTLGFSQIADYLVIEDANTRGARQAEAIALAHALLAHPEQYRTVSALIAAVPGKVVPDFNAAVLAEV